MYNHDRPLHRDHDVNDSLAWVLCIVLVYDQVHINCNRAHLLFPSFNVFVWKCPAYELLCSHGKHFYVGLARQICTPYIFLYTRPLPTFRTRRPSYLYHLIEKLICCIFMIMDHVHQDLVWNLGEVMKPSHFRSNPTPQVWIPTPKSFAIPTL